MTPQDSLPQLADSSLAVPDTLLLPADSSAAVPDTLGLPGLQAEPPVTLQDLPSLDDCSYFADDTLLHAEVPGHTYGFPAIATPFRLRHDGWTGLLLFACLLLAAVLLRRLRGKFRDLLRTTFLPAPGKEEIPVNDDPLRYSTRLTAVGLLSLTATAVTFVCTQHDAGFFLFPETPYLLLLACLALWLGYFLVKRLTTDFVNWIFFRREKIITWTRAYTFILVVEALFSFPIALIAVFLPVSPDMVLLIALVMIALVKIILLFKTHKIFFRKMYGVLHLFAYLCTLELTPLLVLLQVLAFSDWLKVIKI
ncbi:MAG: DUF4271 domain-containing protein [Bacteroidaceae bacterium]|nr:DUF4271 domain-containing protein [Bacteroidaceae bacterium]